MALSGSYGLSGDDQQNADELGVSLDDYRAARDYVGSNQSVVGGQGNQAWNTQNVGGTRAVRDFILQQQRLGMMGSKNTSSAPTTASTPTSDNIDPIRALGAAALNEKGYMPPQPTKADPKTGVGLTDATITSNVPTAPTGPWTPSTTQVGALPSGGQLVQGAPPANPWAGKTAGKYGDTSDWYKWVNQNAGRYAYVNNQPVQISNDPDAMRQISQAQAAGTLQTTTPPGFQGSVFGQRGTTATPTQAVAVNPQVPSTAAPLSAGVASAVPPAAPGNIAVNAVPPAAPGGMPQGGAMPLHSFLTDGEKNILSTVALQGGGAKKV
jgi:hypothetical protein